MKPENDPEITDNVSLDLFQEIVKNSNEASKTCKLKNSELRIDSGVSSPLPTGVCSILTFLIEKILYSAILN